MNEDLIVSVRCAEYRNDRVEVAEASLSGHLLLTTYESVGSGERDSSVYLTPKTAKRLAKALRKWAKEAGQ